MTTKYPLLILVLLAGFLAVTVAPRDHQRTTAADSPRILSFEIKGRDSQVRVDTFHLENGLRVIAIAVPEAKTTTVMVSYKVGSADDPPDTPGLAHFVEHATFGALGEENDEQVERSVGEAEFEQPEAFTSYDQTAYYQVVPPEGLEEAVRVEALRLGGLNIDRRAVESERAAVLEERAQDIEADPEALLEDQIRMRLWAGTPYGHSVVSNIEETGRISVQDVRAFYNSYYVPNNALLIASGKIDLSEVIAFADKYFGDIPGQRAPIRRRPKPMLPVSDRQVTLTDPDIHETFWARTYIAPSFAKSGNGLVAATSVLAEFLSADLTKLIQALAGKPTPVEDLDVHYRGDAVGYSTLSIHAVLSRSTRISDFEQALDGTLRKLVSEGITDAEVESARDRVLQTIAATWDDPVEAAIPVGAAFASGRTIQDVIAWDKEVEAVTPNRVRDAARHIFTRNNGVGGVLLRE